MPFTRAHLTGCCTGANDPGRSYRRRPGPPPPGRLVRFTRPGRHLLRQVLLLLRGRGRHRDVSPDRHLHLRAGAEHGADLGHRCAQVGATLWLLPDALCQLSGLIKSGSCLGVGIPEHLPRQRNTPYCKHARKHSWPQSPVLFCPLSPCPCAPSLHCPPPRLPAASSLCSTACCCSSILVPLCRSAPTPVRASGGRRRGSGQRSVAAASRLTSRCRRRPLLRCWRRASPQRGCIERENVLCE